MDEVVIARGDLGNAMPLWELPRCQKQLSAVCRSAGVPFMVVTQMLDSMCSRAVPGGGHGVSCAHCPHRLGITQSQRHSVDLCCRI